MADPTESFFQSVPPPEDLDEVTSAVRKFMELHKSTDRPVALITSGGTTVPLEKRTVRFIDNFSTGSRGAASTEYFLARGYAVVFLYRESSLKPYERCLVGGDVLEWFTLDSGRVTGLAIVESQFFNPPFQALLRASLPPAREAKLSALLAQYSKTKSEGTLLLLPYTTLFQYLHLLRRVSNLLGELGSRVLVYLAAAVADFYVHPADMAEHKIQSSGELKLHLEHTPKMVGLLREHWAPHAYIVTFKLETDETVLVDSAKAALQKYKHQLVVANLLSTRKTSVTIVTNDFQEVLQVSQEEVGRGVEIEERLVNVLVNRCHCIHS